jgi:hypothetical protein
MNGFPWLDVNIVNGNQLGWHQCAEEIKHTTQLLANFFESHMLRSETLQNTKKYVSIKHFLHKNKTNHQIRIKVALKPY